MRQRQTQLDQIVQLLWDANQEWVPLYKIIPLAAQYSARVHEARKMGHQIENKVETINGQKHSWFRLLRPRGQGKLFDESAGRPTAYQGPRTPTKFLWSKPAP